MSIIDSQLLLSSAQALTVSGNTTDYFDMSKVRKIGSGEQLSLVFRVTTDADYTTTDETYTFALQSDDNTSFSSPTTVASRLFSLANGNPPGVHLKAGAQVVIPIPPDLQEQYLRGYLTLGGTTPSISVSAEIVPTSFISKPAIYPSGFKIQ